MNRVTLNSMMRADGSKAYCIEIMDTSETMVRIELQRFKHSYAIKVVNTIGKLLDSVSADGAMVTT